MSTLPCGSKGGPIAAIKTGDLITFDITKRRLDVNLTQKDIAACVIGFGRGRDQLVGLSPP